MVGSQGPRIAVSLSSWLSLVLHGTWFWLFTVQHGVHKRRGHTGALCRGCNVSWAVSHSGTIARCLQQIHCLGLCAHNWKPFAWLQRHRKSRRATWSTTFGTTRPTWRACTPRTCLQKMWVRLVLWHQKCAHECLVYICAWCSLHMPKCLVSAICNSLQGSSKPSIAFGSPMAPSLSSASPSGAHDLRPPPQPMQLLYSAAQPEKCFSQGCCDPSCVSLMNVQCAKVMLERSWKLSCSVYTEHPVEGTFSG